MRTSSRPRVKSPGNGVRNQSPAVSGDVSSGTSLVDSSARPPGFTGSSSMASSLPRSWGAWGIRRTADLGEIVFNMIDIGQMRKTRNDKREDFHNVFEFGDAFASDIPFAVPDAV